MSREEIQYDLQGLMTLNHLADTVLTISEMKRDGSGERQYFINTTYRLSSDKRSDPNDVGVRRTKGFSVTASDIGKLAAMLMQFESDAQRKHYFVCYDCTDSEGKLVVHEKKTAAENSICPLKLSNPSQNAKEDAFVVR